ncbi:MAG: hypothetical protein C4523_09345 [Myxococcales bacterium]|nr:MAG: hypothetical protein C4523_09345 [Myxococcales bacterium]
MQATVKNKLLGWLLTILTLLGAAGVLCALPSPGADVRAVIAADVGTPVAVGGGSTEEGNPDRKREVGRPVHTLRGGGASTVG